MKQSRLFPPVLVSFIIIVLVNLPHLSVAVASWDNIDYSESGYYDSLHHLGDNPRVPTSDLDEFNTSKIIWTTYSVQLFQNPDEIPGRDFLHDIFINDIFYVMPDELLTLQINSQPSIPDESSEWDNSMQPASEPADHIVFDNNADYIRSLRIPAPTSLLLVVLGLISLRYTRSLRF